MTAPTTPGTAAGNSPAVPANIVADWIIALDVLRADVKFDLDRRGIVSRLLDLADDMRDARDHAGTTP